MSIVENNLILNVNSKCIEIGNKEKLYKVTASKIVFEANDHSITKFQTISNSKECMLIVNCGLTPPQIFFNFNEIQELIEIDHDYQTEVISKLKLFELKNVL